MGNGCRDTAGTRRLACLAGCATGLAAAAAGLAVLAGGGWSIIRAADRAWVLPADTSRTFLAGAAAAGASGVALAATGRMLWRAGAPARRARRRRRRGTVMIEFALALPIALGLTLIMIQSSLLMVGNLCVHYAAFCAARTAIVQVPSDRSPAEQPNRVAGPDDSAKLLRIRRAAVWAVMPVSCSHADAPAGQAATLTDGLARFFRQYGRNAPAWVRRNLDRRVQYALDHTRVQLLPPLDGAEYKEHEDLRVTVEHTLYLSVPYAGRLFALLDGEGGVRLDFGGGQYGTVIRATCALPNEGVHDYIDVEPFPQ